VGTDAGTANAMWVPTMATRPANSNVVQLKPRPQPQRRSLEKLTDLAVRNARIPPGRRFRKLADGGGLSLFLTADGTGAIASRRWRLAYRFAGKESTLGLGSYPEVSLREARARAGDARALLRDGKDPSATRRDERTRQATAAENTFTAVALDWLKRKHGAECVPAHADRTKSRLLRDVFPWIGSRPITELKPPEILAAIRKIEARGRIESAHRALSAIGQVLRYAVASGLCESDATRDLRGALMPAPERHFPAVTEVAKLGPVLRKLHAYAGSPAVVAALRLGPLLIVRPGELRSARWAEIYLETAEWRFTVSKTHTAHIVPLPSQAVAILRELQAETGKREFVFPGQRDPARRPMSENAVLVALRSIGIAADEMVGHSWRATARTLLAEELGFRPELIELQLGHRVADSLGRAYNRTQFIDERRAMLQRWADYLDSLRTAPG
jgi:integrase